MEIVWHPTVVRMCIPLRIALYQSADPPSGDSRTIDRSTFYYV